MWDVWRLRVDAGGPGLDHQVGGVISEEIRARKKLQQGYVEKDRWNYRLCVAKCYKKRFHCNMNNDNVCATTCVRTRH